MRLYDIDERIRECVNALSEVVDEETGEITDDMMAELLMEKLQQLDIDRKEKIEGVCLMKIEADREAEAIGEEIKRLQKKKKSAENRSESSKRYVTNALQGDKLKTDRVSVYYMQNKKVDVYNERELPDDYVRIKLEPDKDAIKKAINKGEVVPGATLIDSVSTVIR